jgi:hypothetical protein
LEYRVHILQPDEANEANVSSRRPEDLRVSPLAGQRAETSMLVGLPTLIGAYYELVPDPAVPEQRVSFGTSGHRGSSLSRSFNESHILAISQAICLYRRHRFVGVLECAEFALFEITGNRQRQLLRVGTHASELCGDLGTALRRIKRHRPRVTLRLGRELGLRKLLNLPLAAGNDLDQLLRFEMDRLSPFGADNVYFAYRVVRIDPKAGSILVEVQIVPRKKVDRALASAERLGLQARRVELDGAAADEKLN